MTRAAGIAATREGGPVRTGAPTVAALGTLVLGVACGLGHPAGAPPVPAAGPPSVVVDNVERGSYAGSAACAPCHEAETRAWSASAMHRMTRTVPGAEVTAPFDGTTFHFQGDEATLETHDAQRFIRLSSNAASERVYRVTKVIGGRVREDYAGVAVTSFADRAVGAAEMVLPISWLKGTRTLRYKGYSVLVHERQRLEAGPPYSETCILCHNTAPYLVSLYGALANKQAPAYQGEVIDRLLPDATRWTYRAVDPRAMTRAIAREVGTLGPHDRQPNEALPDKAIAATRARFDAGHLVELGIGCESCHGGSREHAVQPATRPSYAPIAPWLSAGPADGRPPSRAEDINHVCGRCHQVLFSRYPWTWEGGSRTALAGGSTINSGEARDFLLGGCSKAMACTACHDPHSGGLTPAAAAIETPAGNGVCTGCHAALASSAALRAHAHHDPAGAGGACVACHMPKKNMSLTGGLTRYHRIGSPTDPLRVLGDRPLECALCHADKSVSDLVQTMEAWWNKAYDRDILSKLYGDLSARPLEATLARGKPHEQALAAARLGDVGARGEATSIARVLSVDRPLVRQYAQRALIELLGPQCTIDLSHPLTAIEREADGCLARAGLPAVAWPAAGTRAAGTAEPLED